MPRSQFRELGGPRLRRRHEFSGHRTSTATPEGRRERAPHLFRVEPSAFDQEHHVDEVA
jgi:hypothetical protein